MTDNRVLYTADLLIFGIDSRESDNLRSLPRKYFSILLVKRSKEPFKDKWCLPGGYVKTDETSKDASKRILRKETGLTDVYMQQIGIYDGIGRDPRGRTISASYMALVDRTLLKEELDINASWFDIEINSDKDNINVKLTNSVEEIVYDVERVTIDKKTNEYEYKVLNKSGLAFDHDEIIIKGIMDLRHKVDSTDIVFNLMPSEFTIGQLKQVYELLLGRKLVNSAFRRIIAPKVVETDLMVKTGGHRPSMLYKYNEENE